MSAKNGISPTFLRVMAMNEYLTIRITKSLDADKIVGIDGKIYKVGYGMILRIPKLNAMAFLMRGAAEIVDEVDLFFEEAML